MLNACLFIEKRGREKEREREREYVKNSNQISRLKVVKVNREKEYNEFSISLYKMCVRVYIFQGFVLRKKKNYKLMIKHLHKVIHIHMYIYGYAYLYVFVCVY